MWEEISRSELTITFAARLPTGVLVLHRTWEACYSQGKLCRGRSSCESMEFVPGVSYVVNMDGRVCWSVLDNNTGA